MSKSSGDGNRFLSSTDWKGYLSLLETFADRRLKITYDRGALELLSPSRKHERIKKLIAQIVEFACFEKGVDYCGLGSTTYRRQALERGLEPDECYYFGSSLPEETGPEVPAPDLAIEVEISHSSLDRIGIYAALGVTEVWRYTSHDQVVVLTLGEEGYSEAEASRFLPFLPPQALTTFVRRGLELRNNRLLLGELRDWAFPRPLEWGGLA